MFNNGSIGVNKKSCIKAMDQEYRSKIKCELKSDHDKRRSVKFLLGAAAASAFWHKPVINSVVLPAHAQTSTIADSITAASLDANNPFSRFVLIVDSNDTVLANCGESGGTASAVNLPSGSYRIFADSDGQRTHIIDISTGNFTQQVTVETMAGDCNFLVATVELPTGVIVPATGEQVTSTWACSTNQNTSCS